MRRAIETQPGPRPRRGAHPALAGLCVLWLCALGAFARADDARPPAAAPEAAAEALRTDRGLGTPPPSPAPPSTEPAPRTGAAPSAAARSRTPAGKDKVGIDDKGGAQWLALEPGLDFGEFRLEGGDFRLTALRIDPEKFDFELCASSADGKGPRALDAWGEERDLVAAINASMYREDGSTSTGYMRGAGHVNNPRLVDRFGAFFVAGPDAGELPQAAIIDRDMPDWKERIGRYDLVIQNYRMINGDRRILWSPGGPLYSISAVAQDGAGRILFLHSRAPVEAYAFAQQLLHLPLDVRTVMYVEGGAQAGLLVRSHSLRRDMGGLHAPSLLVTGNLKALLPNVLGVRRKRAPRPEAADMATGGH
ncbi:MAG: phosphodiester glycosidase family protein [Desulfovibrio sp.]|nr:phosphodiester glycosidase family protein [Desulfovibrio sp.]